MTSQDLSMYSGAVLSLLFTYIPKLNTWYAKLDPPAKRLLMLGLVLLVAGASFGLSCIPDFIKIAGVTCDKEGAIGLLKAFVAAAIANQAAYLFAPRPAALRSVVIKETKKELGVLK